MTTRAMEFAGRWLKEHVHDAPKGPISASELADLLLADAAQAGIPADEVEGDLGTVFGSVLEMVYAALEYKRVEGEG